MAGRETFQQGQRARALFDTGMACNAIARELGVGAATISRWAKREGLSFARDATALAVRARSVDIADSRTLLTKKLLAVAHETLDHLDGPYLVYNFGGSENTYEEHLLDAPPVDVVRTAVTIGKDAHTVATKTLEQTPEGLRGAESLLDRLEAGLSRFDGDADDNDIAE
jgi:hypothetical protein